MLGVYSSVVLWTLQYHEKWADEAQAWLIARDLDLQSIWFHELRYEGSPGLWHTILWIAQHALHAKYSALGYIGAVFAIGGAAVLLFLAPFPRIIRWPLAFSYVMVYQYAVIARPYTLFPLLAFCAALLFKDLQHPGRLAIALILLSLLTLHGTILAACLGLAYLVEAFPHRHEFDASTTKRYLASIAAMALVFVFIAAILKPTPDVEEFAIKRSMAKLSHQEREQVEVSPTRKAEAIISGAFLDYTQPSLLFLALIAVWFYRRHRLMEYIMPLALLTVLYSFVHGYPHHHGTAFIAVVTAAWIAWPTHTEILKFTKVDKWVNSTMSALMLILCAMNIADAAVSIRREYLFPYSGSLDAASYLKTVGADKNTMFGFLFGVNAVQAYFDHNLFSNIDTSYYHLGLPLQGTSASVDDLDRVKPVYVVCYSIAPQVMMDTGVPLLARRGYTLVHFSDGYYLYKRAVYQRETYFIFRRSTAVSATLDKEHDGAEPRLTGVQ